MSNIFLKTFKQVVHEYKLSLGVSKDQTNNTNVVCSSTQIGELIYTLIYRLFLQDLSVLLPLTVSRRAIGREQKHEMSEDKNLNHLITWLKSRLSQKDYNSIWDQKDLEFLQLNSMKKSQITGMVVGQLVLALLQALKRPGLESCEELIVCYPKVQCFWSSTMIRDMSYLLNLNPVSGSSQIRWPGSPVVVGEFTQESNHNDSHITKRSRCNIC